MRSWGRWWALGALVALAAAARLAHLALVAADVDPSLDAVWYRLVSLQLAEGSGYVDPTALLTTGASEPTAHFPPGWPAVLSLGARLGFGSMFAAQVTSCLVGAANVGLLGALGVRHLGPRLGLVAAAVAALHPTLWVVDATALAESAFTTAVLAALVLLDVALRRPVADRVALHWGAAAGAALGAATLVRSDGLLLVGMAAAGLAVAARRRAAVAVLGAAAVVVAPWVARNLSVTGEVTLSGNLAPTLAGANCATTWYGPATGSWDHRCAEPADRGAHDAVAHATGDLRRAPVVAGARLLRTFGLWDPFPDWPDHRVGEDLVGRHRGAHALSWATSLTLLPAAGIGAWRLGARARRTWPLLLPVAHAAAVSVVVYGNQRFRAPAEPVLVLLAVAGAAAVLAAGRRAVQGHLEPHDLSARLPLEAPPVGDDVDEAQALAAGGGPGRRGPHR